MIEIKKPSNNDHDYSDGYYKKNNARPHRDVPIQKALIESHFNSQENEAVNKRIKNLLKKLSGVEEDVFDPIYHLKRIAHVNPKLAASLEFAAEINMTVLEKALIEAVGISKEIAEYKSMTLSDTLEAVKEDIWDFSIEGRVHWKASQDTHVLRLQTKKDHQSYRLCWWVHADNHEVGTEGHLYKEDPAITEHEMGWYE